eukprot:scaffold569_cov408-Prasinococcus_capsulatus_cf.AAC.50
MIISIAVSSTMHAQIRPSMSYINGEWKFAKKKAPKKAATLAQEEEQGGKDSVPASRKRDRSGAPIKGTEGSTGTEPDPVGQPVTSDPPKDFKCYACTACKTSKKNCLVREIWQRARDGHVGAKLAMAGESSVREPHHARHPLKLFGDSRCKFIDEGMIISITRKLAPNLSTSLELLQSATQEVKAILCNVVDRGTIESFNRSKMQNRVLYEDGERHDEDLWSSVTRVVGGKKK